MNLNNNTNSFISMNNRSLVAITVALLLMVGLFHSSLTTMVLYWYDNEEFGHAFLLPAISFYFIWQKRYEFLEVSVTKTWVGIAIVFAGVLLYLLGVLSAIYTIQQNAMVLVIIGLFVSLLGTEISKKVTIPLLLLFFMVPLPGFLYNTLSNNLQLLSSQIGVFVIRLFDISVYLEGNVIDLGVYKLQVVEACSGLRYLFPLMTLGLIASYIYKSSILKKAIIFLSTIPITVLMNSFRIGMIGVLVEYYGIEMAEGFLHDFEGWIIFMACMFILILEMWLLSKFSRIKLPFTELFNIDTYQPENKGTSDLPVKKLSTTIVYTVPLLIIGLIFSQLIGKRIDDVPERLSFSVFPTQVSEYTGKKEIFESNIIDALNFDDYLIANYTHQSDQVPINIYVGYYNTQRADKVPHSPKACLPGGGWIITKSDVISFDLEGGEGDLSVNRVVIHKAGTKQLVYYWFKQRDRNITSEYFVKWYMLIDSIFKNRTDGALVRYVTVVKKGESLTDAELRIQAFIKETNPLMSKYIPD